MIATWFARLRRWNERMHARAIAARDRAPAYWPDPARDEQHQQYRDTWARLAGKPQRTDAEDATLVQILAGLRNYGDDPLVAPPAPSRLAQIMPVVGPLKWWPFYAIGALLVALGLQSVRVDRLKLDVERAAAARDAWAQRAETANRNYLQEYGARMEAASNALKEEARSAELEGERNELREALAQRQRSRRNEAQSRDAGAVVDYTERLRELSGPPAAAVPGVPAADAAGDSPG